MPVSIILSAPRVVRSLAVLAVAFLIGAPLATVPAQADSAYVAQAAGGNAVPVRANGFATSGPITFPISQQVHAPMPTPEMAAMRGSGQVAQTLQIGSQNHVAHLQVGSGNQSTAGIIGNLNQVGVLQAGNNLRSNVVLLGTQGLSVGVIQPQGSAPVNMLIARLPNGGLLIKR